MEDFRSKIRLCLIFLAKFSRGKTHEIVPKLSEKVLQRNCPELITGKFPRKNSRNANGKTIPENKRNAFELPKNPENFNNHIQMGSHSTNG